MAGTESAIVAAATNLFAPDSLAILNFHDARLCSRLGRQPWRRRGIRKRGGEGQQRRNHRRRRENFQHRRSPSLKVIAAAGEVLQLAEEKPFGSGKVPNKNSRPHPWT
ncbi:MAG: hypothetical protein HC869_17735 [Rhodospirillales bacterium]|nr:hypothetical protein [Rhodospirillales bacterium]